MALTIGTVDCLNVGDDFCFVGIRDAETGDVEAFVLWFAPNQPSAFTRVLNSMWFSMLQEARKIGEQVQISHEDDSALVRALRVNTPP